MSYAIGARRNIIEWRARFDASVPTPPAGGTSYAPVTHRWKIYGAGRRNVVVWQITGTVPVGGSFQAAWALGSNSIIGVT